MFHLRQSRICLALVAMLWASYVLGGSAFAQIDPSQLRQPNGQVHGPPPLEYVNLDHYYGTQEALPGGPIVEYGEPWSWQILPSGLIYRSYLAGAKEPRFSTQIVNEEHQGWLFDATLGARVGLIRYGTHDPLRPDGFEIDAEGAAQLRMDLPDDVDVFSVDFRAGMPITFGSGPHRTKFAYYHLSSHVGDEFLLKNPGFRRLNYSRDVLVLGHSYYFTDSLLLYGAAGWAFYSDVGKPWEFQFGADYAPPCPTGIHGAPFAAFNGHLREEVDFGGALTVQAGWAWRSRTSGLLRLGLHYYNGKSNQFSFFNEHEQQIGFGVWYDF